MAYTIFSFIGTGMYKEGYRTSTYKFPDGKKYTTRLFLEAVLKCKYREIGKIVLVGTKTSSWDILIDTKKDEESESLWEKILEECNSSDGIKEESAKELEAFLSRQFGIETVCKIHTNKIDNDTAKEVFECYRSIIPFIPKNSDVLFDITHGFRSMPLLLFQALQFSFSNGDDPRSVEIVYGEYNKETNFSTVRNLSNYWTYSELGDALNIFETKLDGYKLASLIEKDWPEGSKAIKRISDIAQTNFALQVEDVCRQVKNAIQKYPLESSISLEKVKFSLENYLSIVSKENLSESLLSYAKYLYSLRLNTQAIITLQLAVETSVTLKEASYDRIGDYEWWQNYGRESLNKLMNERSTDLRKSLKNLEYFRNQIAHGGAKNRETGGFPNAQNIPSIYSSSLKGVERLLRILKEQ